MESYDLVIPDGSQEALERLGNAVVERAADDYLRAYKKLDKNPDDWEARYQVAECEWFFCTKQIQIFSAVNGKELFAKLKQQAQKQCQKRKKPAIHRSG